MQHFRSLGLGSLLVENLLVAWTFVILKTYHGNVEGRTMTGDAHIAPGFLPGAIWIRGGCLSLPARHESPGNPNVTGARPVKITQGFQKPLIQKESSNHVGVRIIIWDIFLN